MFASSLYHPDPKAPARTLNADRIESWYWRTSLPTVIKVARVPLDSGGYASDGRYFGRGSPLYSIDAIEEMRDLSYPRYLPEAYARGDYQAIRSLCARAYPAAKVLR
jgi:hypothetical protein